MTALAAAVHFDFELASNVAPFARLIEELFASEPGALQFFIPITNRKARPPTPLKLASLLKRISDGVALAAVETPLPTPDHEQLRISAETTPIAQHPERFFARTRCNYSCHADVGAAQINRLGARRVLGAIIAFADAVRARAGVIHWADTTRYASCLASGGGSSQLSSEQCRHVSDLMYWQPRWGDVIRGPQWGTFLGVDHVERLGGLSRIEHESGCARVIALGSGGAFLQATPIDEPIVEDHDDGGVLSRLSQFLSPRSVRV
jgi:hypothetical protein